MRIARLSCFLLPAFVQMAAAGVLLVEAGTDFRAAKPIEREVKIEAWRVSIEIRDAQDHQTIVYQTSPQQVWMIDHKQKFYREFNRATLTMLKEQIRAVRDSVKSQSQDASDSTLQFDKAWDGETVGEWTCDKYEGRVSGAKVWDVCVASWSQFEVRPADFNLLREAMTTLQDILLWPAHALLPPGATGKQNGDGYVGVPVQRVQEEDGRTVALLELRELTTRDFTDSDFSPPSDYLSRPVMLMPAEEGQKNMTQPKGKP